MSPTPTTPLGNQVSKPAASPAPMTPMIVNLTPHSINVIPADGSPAVSFPPSGTVLRIRTDTFPAHAMTSLLGVPITTVTTGGVVNLPAPQMGVFLIVSTMVAQALRPSRTDLLSPGDLVRDDAGQPIGCRSLVC